MRGGHSGPIWQLVYASNGSFFASAANDNTVKIWRASDNMLLRTLYVPRGSEAVAVSPDNSLLCAGGASIVTALPLIRCWHTTDWSMAWTADSIPNTVASDSVTKLSFSPDGQRLASSVGFRLPIFNSSDGSFIADFAGPNPIGFAGGAVYSPDGNLFAVNTAGAGTRLALLDADTGSLAFDFGGFYASFGYDMGFTTDSQLVVSVNAIGTRVFGAYDHLQRSWDLGSPAVRVAFSSDGARMVTGHYQYAFLNLFNAATGKIIKQWDGHGSSGQPPAIGFSPDSTRLLSANLDIKRWKASDGSFDSLITGQVGPLWPLAVSGNEAVTATVAPSGFGSGIPIDEHVISLFRTSDGALLRYIDYGPSASNVRGVALSPDGKHVALSDDNGLRVWNVATGALEHSHAEGGQTSQFRPITFTADGSAIVEGGTAMPSLSVWDLATDTLTYLTAGSARVLKTLPDGRLLVGLQPPSPSQPTVEIVTLAGHIDRQLTGLSSVFALAASPDGQTIAAAGVDAAFSPAYVARTWRVSDGATLHTFVGHTSYLFGVGFSWDGQTLVTGSQDATVRIWRTSDATQLHLYDTETYITTSQNPSAFPGVWSVFSSNSSGQFLYGRGDGTVVAADNPEAAPAIATFDVPSDLTGGCKAPSGKVVLDRPAPPAGLTVNLSSSSPDVSVPASLTFKSGVSKKTFKITTTAVTALETATITATLGGQTLNATTDVHPIGVASLTLTPSTVVGGNSVAGTVSLECDTAPGDVVVTLSSSIPSVAQPSPTTVTIPHGAMSATFSMTTSAVTATKKPTIKAETVPGAQSKSKKLVVNP